MNAIQLGTGILLAGVLLAGCDSATGGNPTSSVPTSGSTTSSSSTTTSGATTSGATSSPTTTATVSPTQKGVVAPPEAEVLAPQDGYVFIATKSGSTRCQVSTAAVSCESQFANAPKINDEVAHGVRVSSDGKVQWVLGNLGAIPTVTIDDRSYSALGWTIAATADGTKFTNQTSGHGMYLSSTGVQGF